MRIVLLSGAVGFAITVGAFAVIADNSFWTPSVSQSEGRKSEPASFTSEPSVQDSAPSSPKKQEHLSANTRHPQNEEEMTVVLRKKSEDKSEDKPVEKIVAMNKVSAQKQAEKLVEKVAEEPAKHAAETAPKYSVQIASYKSNDEAEAKLMNLKSTGYEGFVQPATVNGAQYYRVKVGPVESRQEAQKLQAQLAEKSSLSSTIITRD